MNINSKKRKLVKVTEQITEDGSIHRTATYSSTPEDSFIKVYLKDILYLTGLAHYHYEILFAILQRVDYRTNTVGLHKIIKEEIALETGYKASTLNNAIQLLKDTEVLLPVARGYYKVNPFLFGSGSWRDIIAVRAIVDWNRDGKTIKTILESKNEK